MTKFSTQNFTFKTQAFTHQITPKILIQKSNKKERELKENYMTIRKPEYYDEFVCTADKCPFTCCREWKIEVDDETNEKWKKLQAPENVYPVRKNMSQYTQKKDNMRVIALNKKHICPFLNEQKLCRLVCTFGDDVLSKTCRIFPREIHKFLATKTSAKRTEV